MNGADSRSATSVSPNVGSYKNVFGSMPIRFSEPVNGELAEFVIVCHRRACGRVEVRECGLIAERNAR